MAAAAGRAQGAFRRGAATALVIALCSTLAAHAHVHVPGKDDSVTASTASTASTVVNTCITPTASATAGMTSTVVASAAGITAGVTFGPPPATAANDTATFSFSCTVQ